MILEPPVNVFHHNYGWIFLHSSDDIIAVLISFPLDFQDYVKTRCIFYCQHYYHSFLAVDFGVGLLFVFVSHRELSRSKSQKTDPRALEPLTVHRMKYPFMRIQTSSVFIVTVYFKVLCEILKAYFFFLFF